MARWVHDNVHDNGLNYIKTNAQRVLVLAAYALNDSYATVTGGSNILAEAAVSSTDFTLAAGSPSGRKITSTAKTDSSANATNTSTHLAFVDDTNSRVLWVTDESSGQTIYTGNGVNIPAVSYTMKQPDQT